MKKILGLDLGTNSIGWALVNTDENGSPMHIEGMGSRIIPMGSDKIDYEKGASITKNAERRMKRSARRMNKRYKMRRNKLLFILYKLNMLPQQFVFKNKFPEANKLQELELLPISKGEEQLTALEHYELKEKALTAQISLQELGCILYQYNTLRGYSGGGDNNNDNNKKEQIEEESDKPKYEVKTNIFTLKKVEQSDNTFKVKSGKDKGKELYYYNLTVIDEDSKEIEGSTTLQNLAEKIDSEIELEVRTKHTKKSTSITFALPQKTNWRKQMEETEKILKEKQYFPCQLFAEELRKNKWTKIRRRVILRQQYKKEFDAVWEEQAKHYPFLNDCPKDILQEILLYIFPGQSETQQHLRDIGLQNGLKYIIKEQVIYYQRPLKPQTELIRKCQYEKEEQVIATSHPLFQEFRCWDQINRLYITSKQPKWNEQKKKEVLQYENRYLTEEQKLTIYNKLKSQKQLSYSEVAKIVNLKNDNSEYLNGLHSKAKLAGCDTTISINKILGDLAITDTDTYTNIWEAIYKNVHEGSEYDVDSKRVQSIINALPNNIEEFKRIELGLSLAQKVKFTRKYANLSEKAIKNILPLMQLHPQDIPEVVFRKYENVLHLISTGEIISEEIPQNYIIDFIKNNPNALEEGGLMYAFASSLVYGRHTKESIKPQITNYHDIKYIGRNLRNPIVEQIANETMQVIKAIWKQYNLNPNELEIRVELARDLKNSAQEREKIYKGQNDNRKINDTIKKRLIELKQETSERNIELYKLWNKQSDEPQPKFKDSKAPTKEEIEKMRLWEEQHHIDPYTLKVIPLSKLFSSNGKKRLYDIDHIIPKSRYFDNSIANKVVCESKINEEKDNRTAWQYISQQNSKIGICSTEEYVQHVNRNFYGQKKKNLLAESIPSNPVARQLKDTQYISTAIKDELAKIVGSENIKTSTGGVTDYLRQHWGLKKLFMEITESRFDQMKYLDVDEEGNPKNLWVNKYNDGEKNVYEIKGWNKRYDHRHHAIDALVVALTNDKYIKRLNDLNKYFQEELAKHKNEIPLTDDTLEESFFNLEEDKRKKIMKEIEGSRKFLVPIEHLVSEAKKHIESMIVSQKPKDKLAIKHIDNKKQLKIRAALHQETYYGKTNNRDTKTIEISKLNAKIIESEVIIDKVLEKEIINHKLNYESYKEAFTGEGIVEFNDKRISNKKHPVYTIKIWYNKEKEKESSLQQLYEDNNNKSVITGDNYLFIVMNKGKKRFFDIVSLYDAVDIASELVRNNDIQVNSFKEKICDDIRIINKNKPTEVLFYLQQNDLVYMPKEDTDEILDYSIEELKKWLSNNDNMKDFVNRIYRVVKFTGNDCFFIPNNYAKEICIPKDISENKLEDLKQKNKNNKISKKDLNFVEFGSYRDCSPTEKNELFMQSINNKNYKGKKPRKIQEYCVKIKTDWLGNIIEFNGLKL